MKAESLCYLCERPTEDWTEPCECGSRAFYRGRSLKGRYPDFGANGQVVSGRLPQESDGDMVAPAFLLGPFPHTNEIKDESASEEVPTGMFLRGASRGSRVHQSYKRRISFA